MGPDWVDQMEESRDGGKKNQSVCKVVGQWDKMSESNKEEEITTVAEGR